MSSAVLLLVLLSSPSQTDSLQQTAADLKQRPFHEIHRDLRTGLRWEAGARTSVERAAAVYRLTEIYTEIRRDPRLATSNTLNGYKARLWGRLTKVKDDIRKHVSHQQRLGRRRENSTRDDQAGDNQAGDNQVAAVAKSLSDTLSLVGGSSGGPAKLLSQVGGSFGGGAIPDYGPDLVALIQRTIVPEFWDVQGGPGTIVYYRPLMVLVVRATDDVHHRIGGTLGGVRAAGR